LLGRSESISRPFQHCLKVESPGIAGAFSCTLDANDEATFAALLVVVPAQAQDFFFKPYVSGGLGGYALDYGNQKDFVLGGYGALGADLHEFLAAEIRLGTTGSKKKRDTTTALTESDVKKQVSWFVSYLAKPRIEIDGLRLYALLGASTVKSSITPTGGTKQEKTDTAFSFGAGGEYQFTNQLSVGAEWMRLTTSKNSDSITATTGYKGMDINSFVGTLKFQF